MFAYRKIRAPFKDISIHRSQPFYLYLHIQRRNYGLSYPLFFRSMFHWFDLIVLKHVSQDHLEFMGCKKPSWTSEYASVYSAQVNFEMIDDSPSVSTMSKGKMRITCR